MPETKGSILYVGGFELPDKNPAAHRVISNAKIFKKLGYKVIFAGIDKSITEIPEVSEIMGFDSIPIPYPNSSKQWVRQMLNITHYIDLLNKYGDIIAVVCYNLHAIPLLKLLNYCQKHKIKVIADSTEWYENKFSFNPINFIRFIDTLLCMRYVQKKCDGMIAISNYLENYYKKYIKNIIVVPPLVELKDNKFKKKEVDKVNSATTLVYSGNPSAAKESLGEVVGCLNDFKNVNYKLRVVGITYDQFCCIYNILPDREKIEFLGHVSHQKALNEVKNADFSIIIRPKTRVTMAGFPTKLAESVSCMTPVIVNDFSDVKSYVKEYGLGVLADDFETLDQALLFAIEMSENQISYLRNCCKKCTVFDWNEYVKKFEVFLEKLL